MKLTWFGSDTFRIHAAGSMIVVEGKDRLAGVDHSELVSGADHVFAFDAAPTVPAGWKPRAPLKMLEAGEGLRAPDVVQIGNGALAVDADGEAPLILLKREVELSGRWVGQSVVAMVGTNLARRGESLLLRHAPRLLALAGSDAEVEAAFGVLPPLLDGTGLVALERALAVEV
ncbi:hypothetical protein SAMN05216456_1236 [Devosia crocina]|uniref:Uncharacterized protein n=1 Tax=Devosia crocina TaxID=429728 RepID=A0A1I7N8U5_9HYPH|nr:hypothetical protein [Devosia crocina]SFV31114.1 hypothetical protein SAMN05216456_1236 [Devosia crocina]